MQRHPSESFVTRFESLAGTSTTRHVARELRFLDVLLGLVVRPGVTGFAQVRRGYETSMAEKLAHDLEWIADRSVRLYLRTLLATALRVVAQSVRLSG